MNVPKPIPKSRHRLVGLIGLFVVIAFFAVVITTNDSMRAGAATPTDHAVQLVAIDNPTAAIDGVIPATSVSRVLDLTISPVSVAIIGGVAIPAYLVGNPAVLVITSIHVSSIGSTVLTAITPANGTSNFYNGIFGNNGPNTYIGTAMILAYISLGLAAVTLASRRAGLADFAARIGTAYFKRLRTFSGDKKWAPFGFLIDIGSIVHDSRFGRLPGTDGLKRTTADTATFALHAIDYTGTHDDGAKRLFGFFPTANVIIAASSGAMRITLNSAAAKLRTNTTNRPSNATIDRASPVFSALRA